jgi:hypothetical protein
VPCGPRPEQQPLPCSQAANDCDDPDVLLHPGKRMAVGKAGGRPQHLPPLHALTQVTGGASPEQVPPPRKRAATGSNSPEQVPAFLNQAGRGCDGRSGGAAQLLAPCERAAVSIGHVGQPPAAASEGNEDGDDCDDDDDDGPEQLPSAQKRDRCLAAASGPSSSEAPTVAPPAALPVLVRPASSASPRILGILGSLSGLDSPDSLGSLCIPSSLESSGSPPPPPLPPPPAPPVAAALQPAGAPPPAAPPAALASPGPLPGSSQLPMPRAALVETLAAVARQQRSADNEAALRAMLLAHAAGIAPDLRRALATARSSGGRLPEAEERGASSGGPEVRAPDEADADDAPADDEAVARGLLLHAVGASVIGAAAPAGGAAEAGAGAGPVLDLVSEVVSAKGALSRAAAALADAALGAAGAIEELAESSAAALLARLEQEEAEAEAAAGGGGALVGPPGPALASWLEEMEEAEAPPPLPSPTGRGARARAAAAKLRRAKGAAQPASAETRLAAVAGRRAAAALGGAVFGAALEEALVARVDDLVDAAMAGASWDGLLASALRSAAPPALRPCALAAAAVREAEVLLGGGKARGAAARAEAEALEGVPPPAPCIGDALAGFDSRVLEAAAGLFSRLVGKNWLAAAAPAGA